MAVHKKSKGSRGHIFGGKSETPSRILDWSSIGSAAIFLGFGALLILVCFVGLSRPGKVIRAGQISSMRIVSDFNYQYESAIRTEQSMKQRRERVPPVYRLTLEPYKQFAEFIEKLKTDMETVDTETAEKPPEERAVAARDIARAYDVSGAFSVTGEDIALFLAKLDRVTRKRVLDEGLAILREIYHNGVYDSNMTEIEADSSSLSYFSVQREDGTTAEVKLQSEEDALRALRTNLRVALEIPNEVSQAAFRILRTGLRPNLIFDERRSKEKIENAVGAVKPVTVEVKAGDVIIEPGVPVSPFQLEQLHAYQANEAEDAPQMLLDALFWERVLLTFTILFSGVIYIKIGSRELRSHNRRLTLSASVVVLNLGIIRLVTEMGEANVFGSASGTLVPLLPFLAPVALGPIITTILIGARAGIFVVLIISIFNALMQGNSVPIMVVTFFSALAGIYFTRNIQMRKRVVQAGFMAGLALALCVFFVGIRDGLDLHIILQQSAICVTIGVFTGIVVVGLLPFFETLFKYTTDITLLELTDYNHPLLRKLQMLAPGSYHHSLMVANLAENAAAAIGANPLVCRVCSLYHDIGKMEKPEYFVENQHAGDNPHDLQSPSMSALVIKRHVKEGLVLAREHKLPKVIRDVIAQHHGTSLIQYFYYKALKTQKATQPPFAPEAAPQIELDSVNENTYRYEGPKPQFRESAIVFFSDSIEAASRSMKKVTPQSIEDLIDAIFQDRISDGQLSDCPITLEEITELKRSFAFMLLSMLHSRVEYPSKEDKEEVTSDDRRKKKSDGGKKKSENGKKKQSAEPKEAKDPKDKPAESKPAESGTDKPTENKPVDTEKSGSEGH